ncbi:MAG TPA: hypothetical protein PLN69_12435 [bacterium]|nr:hypothetical protein [bacterium]
MVTLVYICNNCKGTSSERVFEVEYKDIKTAGSAPVPPCPVCGDVEHVRRFFGHNIFAPAKKPRNEVLPANYAPIEKGSREAVVSVGMRLEEEENQTLEEKIKEITGVPDLKQLSDTEDRDLPEEVLGLKKGTVDRALFDIRQKNMIKELSEGKKISGFILPLSGKSSNN